MTEYVKVKLSTTDGNIIIWATKKHSAPFYHFTKVDKYGNTNDTMRVYIVCDEDIIWEKPAQMNNKYAELELKDV